MGGRTGEGRAQAWTDDGCRPAAGGDRGRGQAKIAPQRDFVLSYIHIHIHIHIIGWCCQNLSSLFLKVLTVSDKTTKT